MNELQKMNREIRIYTLVTAVVLSAAGALIMPAYGKEIAVGIMIGALTGLIRFQMIIKSGSSLEADTQNPKGKAYRAYLLRYLVYAAVFAFSIKEGAHIVALLIGMLAHKACILIYTFRHRKEDD